MRHRPIPNRRNSHRMLSRSLAFLLVAALTGASSLAEPPSENQRVGFSGIGDVRIGMSLWDLLVVLEQQATVEMVDNDCTYVLPEDRKVGISFMVTHGTVARVDVVSRGVATVSGIQVGDTESAVKTAYRARVEITHHQYSDGHYMTIKSADGRSALVFETDGKVVTSFRIGRLPEARYIEGCS